jgi:carbamoyl-phosphate synthase small subunit
MFTFPLIGNYGVDRQNFQNPHICALGCITKEICEKPSAQPSIRSFFEENHLLGMSGVDTRALTIKTRVHGTMRAALVVGSDDGDCAIQLARKTLSISDIVPIPEVSCKEPYQVRGSGKRIAVIDLGIKKNMITSLAKRQGDLHVFPYNARSDQVLACKPDALFISNGPGDPNQAPDAIRCIKDLLGQLPIFGICMGNQVCALALGGNTYKLKFGHRGAHQPVRFKDGRIFITTQNHGFAVDVASLKGIADLTHVNLNDQTVEGLAHAELPLFSVQYHPEASPGPHDASYLFTRFLRLMERA